jgi:hypothetical protein
MIELITGSPGAGKTTYAVATRIAVEAKRQITLDAETCVKLGLELGTVVTRRIVCAGVRGLNIEHERLPHLLTRDASTALEVERWNQMTKVSDEVSGKVIETDQPVHSRLPDEPARDVPAIIQNWWLWCRPGDLVVIDEAQFVMPRGTLGRKPAFWLQCFEIHRHYGVDFLIITQHPQLIDTTIRALVGLHRHIRSVMGSALCMVYTWDHASNPERYNLANKGQFLRRASHYKLFHSSIAHVKPPSSGRWALGVVPVLALVGFGGMAWKFSSMGKGSQAQAATSTGSPAKPGASVSGAASASSPAGQARVAGCWSFAGVCRCMRQDGQGVRYVPPDVCYVSSISWEGLVKWQPREAPVSKDYGASAKAAGTAQEAPPRPLPVLDGGKS